MKSTLEVPTIWNEGEISVALARAQGRPTVLAHYVEAVKQRFVLKMDVRTAQVRTQFLRSQIEQLELGKQYQGLVNDLKAMETEQENRLLKLQVENDELRNKRAHEGALSDLRLKKERLAAEVEIEQLKAQKRELRRPAQPASSLSPDQQRRLKRLEIEDKLRELDRLETEDLKKARNEDERLRIENMYTDKREELREQLAKHLV